MRSVVTFSRFFRVARDPQILLASLDATKAVLREKFIVITVYLKKQEKFQINSLRLH